MIYTRHYEIPYDGEIVSTNKFYASGHWGIRSTLKNKYIKIFSILLLKYEVKPMKEFKISLEYNSRHDVDNVGAMVKFFCDTLKLKYVPEDNRKHFKGMSIDFNPDLKKNTLVFHIHCND
jgi:hypothetical protein